MLAARAGARLARPRLLTSAFSGTTSQWNAEELEKQFLVPTYTPNGVRTKEGVAFVRGQGSKLYDQHGKEYVDWAAGIAVNSLGHNDPDWIAAVTKQASKIAHVSNLFHTYEPLHLAKMMVESSKNFQKVFFCNSGTEANEAALKFARKVSLVNAQRKVSGDPTAKPVAFQDFACKSAKPTSCFTKGGMCSCWPQAANNDIALNLKTEVVAFKHSFHGRSMGALAATHKPQIRQPFGPFAGDVKFARFNNIEDLSKYITKNTAAVIVEPVQGEGGVFPATREFMRALQASVTDAKALLIVDEVQCGLGRTGRLWAHEAYETLKPDMMTLAKPLAGGLPIGAVMVTDAVSQCILPGDHGTTYGGNPFVTSVAQTVFRKIADPAFLATSRERGRQLVSGLKALQSKYPKIITLVRGSLDEGLFVGVEIAVPPKPITQAAADKGLLIITAGDNVLRFCPALNIGAADIDFGLRVLDECLAATAPPA